ncbi:YHYH protein [Cobetia sp. 1CM21F]|uniref:YHYH protein n=1 Tax=Cobetia sp. 1CM21F TaxID=2929163 RepID=UPI0020BFD4B1|nr:YHYH protein [Cobetia sp. 1CM21F]MCK8067041.1 YHYH protein [Cobetia sp. 1CM21F]
MTITPPHRATAVRHKARLPAAVLSASVAMLMAGAAHAEVVPSQFSSAALVKAPETVSCTLENGTQTQCTRLVVKYKPDGLKTGPFCPPSLDDEGGIWDWDGENSGLYRLDRAFFEMLDTLGFHFHDDDETLHIMTDLSKRPVEANNCLNVAEDESVKMTVLLPLEPVEADEPTPLGTVAKIGLALDGVPIFADAPSVLDTGNLPALDTCGGHVDPGGWYHWHATATDIDTLYDEHGVDAHCQLPQSHTVQFAYAFDGYPMFGTQDAGGSVPTDLDSCNGHFGPTERHPEGEYHYHATDEFPNLPKCLKGVVAKDNFVTTASMGIGSPRIPGQGPGLGGPGGPEKDASDRPESDQPSEPPSQASSEQ